MGFDQYHEPPEELSQETRTLARIFASLTEEAEAINWYEQRLSVEQDDEARAIIEDARHEEYKHFSMDLEFLLRRRPEWRAIAEGVLFRDGEITRNADAAEEGRGPTTRPKPAKTDRSASAACAGRESMSHLLRSHAPITAEGWQRIDGEARDGSSPRWALGASSTSWARTAGRLRRSNLGRVTALAGRPSDGVEARLRPVLPLVELVVPFELDRARSSAQATAAPRTSTTARSTRPRSGWRGRERRRLPRLGGRRDHRDRRGEPARRARARGRPWAFRRARRDGGRAAPARRDRRPYGLALGEEMWSDVVEGSENGGYPLLRHLEQITDGPTVWTPGLREAVLLSLRGGDFLFESGQDISIGYRATTPPSVELYLEETFTFRVATPEAAIALTSAAKRARDATRSRKSR